MNIVEFLRLGKTIGQLVYQGTDCYKPHTSAGVLYHQCSVLIMCLLRWIFTNIISSKSSVDFFILLIRLKNQLLGNNLKLISLKLEVGFNVHIQSCCSMFVVGASSDLSQPFRLRQKLTKYALTLN